MDHGRVLEELLMNNINVYKVELLLNEKAEFKSATATKVFKELKDKYDIVFTLPELDSENINENICEYCFFMKGDFELSALKELLDNVTSNEYDIDTYFIQKVLMEDIDNIIGGNSLEQVGLEEKIILNGYAGSSQIEKNIKTNSVRIDIGKLSILSSLAAELVTCKAQIIQVQNMLKSLRVTDKGIESVIDYFEKGTSQLERISFDLQEQITQLRMFPIKTVLRKIPRIVRDLKVKCDKDVELVIKGEETELDKMVLEQISDPLVHLVRNCIDHGIEPYDERVKKGKPPKGRITINAYTEGDIVCIEVEDDGRGIDVEKVRNKILVNNLVSEDEVKLMSEEQVIDYIFRPGFSTAEAIDEISGRGVGMDVVRKNISLVKGNIKVENKKDHGTKFVIHIPLTITIIKSLLISASKRLYLIPLDKVVETFKVKSTHLKTVNNKKAVSWNGDIVPILDLEEMLGAVEGNDREYLYTVVIQYRSSKVGITVDRLLGEQETVVKPLDKYIGIVEGIMGATILGDGKVVLMLEPIGLIDRMTM